MARANGKRVLAMIVSRGDTVYRLDAGHGTHTLVGLTSGTKNYQKGKAA